MTAFSFLTNRALNRREIIVASADSDVQFTDIDSSNFYYEFDLLGLVGSASQYVYMRTSTDNGSSFDSGGSDYTYAQEMMGTTTGLANNYATTSFMRINQVEYGTAPNIQDITVGLYNPSATDYTCIEAIVTGKNVVPEDHINKTKAMRLSAADVDAVQFYPSTGTFSGIFVMREYIA